jgi:hypothetical protein
LADAAPAAAPDAEAASGALAAADEAGADAGGDDAGAVVPPQPASMTALTTRNENSFRMCLTSPSFDIVAFLKCRAPEQTTGIFKSTLIGR